MTIFRKGPGKQPLRYRMAAFFRKPSHVILLIFLAVLLALSLFPMITMLGNMFTVHAGNEQRATRSPVGTHTLYHFSKLFAGDDWSRVNFWTPLFNSLIVATGAGILGILVGGTVAWFITCSDLKAKKFISSVFVFPYMMPAWTLALFWTNMFQNSKVGGGNTGMVESLFGVCMPEWFVYGIFPMIVVIGLHYSPFAYLLIGGILKNMDATLEESAAILKASRSTIIRRITVPIVMPAILSTFLLIFSSGFSSYTVPVFLGSAVKCYTLSTKMRALINAGYAGQGYIIAFVSILLGCLILGINQRFTGSRKSFTTVTGKSGQVSLIRLRSANIPICAVLILFTCFFAIMPLVSFALESVIRQPGNYSLSNMTLHFWIGTENSAYETGMVAGILLNSTMWSALGRQVLLALSVSAVVGTCGMLIGYSCARCRACAPVLMSRMLRMLLASLLDRFPLMVRMALRWPLLVKTGSRQSGPLTNTPAHTPSQHPRLLAGATRPGSQSPYPRGCPVLLNPLRSGGTSRSASRGCQAPARSSLCTGCSSQNARPQALEVTSSFSPLST